MIIAFIIIYEMYCHDSIRITLCIIKDYLLSACKPTREEGAEKSGA